MVDSDDVSQAKDEVLLALKGGAEGEGNRAWLQSRGGYLVDERRELVIVVMVNEDAVDRFCASPRIAGKAFRYLTIAELKTLRVKMLSIRHKAELKDYEQRRVALGIEITKGQLPN